MASNNLNAPLNESLSMVEIDRLMRRDYSVLVSGNLSEEKFIDLNEFGYYLCANTWVLRTTDIGSQLLGNLLRATIKEVGLVSAIKVAKDVADRLTRAAHTAERCCYDDSVDVPLPDGLESARMKEWLIRICHLPFVIARKLLLYPKRYCPYVPKHSSALHEAALASFLETNAANVAHERRIASYFWYYDSVEPANRLALPFRLLERNELDPKGWEVLDAARQIVRLIVGDFEGLSHQTFPRVGPGACRNAGPSKLERYGNMVLYGEYELSHTPRRDAGGSIFVVHPDLRTRRYRRRDKAGRLKGVERPPRLTRGFWGTGTVPQICRLSTVPKTVDKNRMIAIEDVCNQSRQLYLKDRIMARIEEVGLSEFMPIRQQSINQQMAYEGAENDDVATLDLSHASDSVLKIVVQKLWPRSWWSYGFERCVPYGFILDEADERPRPLHMFATMGCGCTFPVETVNIFSLTVAAISVEQRYWPNSIEDIKALAEKVRVMGDDTTCPSCYVTAVISALELAGFAVNWDKSFFNGRFRESCGADWFRFDDGVEEVTASYFPRLPIGGDGRKVLHSVQPEWNSTLGEREKKSGLQRVIALQHNSITYPQTNAFLTDLLREYCPEVSSSFPLESDSTIWITPDSGHDACDSEVLRTVERYYVPDAVGPCRKLDQNPSAYYVDHDCAYSYFKQTGLSDGMDVVAAECYTRRMLELTRRDMLNVPTLVVDKAYTGCNTGVAEILAYELSLQALDATAEGILPLAVYGPEEGIAQEMKHRALNSVRPARLSRSGLSAESYKLTFTLMG